MRAGDGRDRVEVGYLAGRHLHGAEGDEVDRLVDRPGQLRGRHRVHRDATARLDEEREQRRGELDLGGEDPRAVRERGRHEPDEPGDGRADRDRGRFDVNQAREGRPRRVGRLAPVLPARSPRAPVVERRLERVPGGPGRQTEARGVEVGARGLPESLRCGDRERHAAILPFSARGRRAAPASARLLSARDQASASASITASRV